MPTNTASYNKKAKSRDTQRVIRNATLTLLNGCFAGLEIAIEKARIVLGRDLNCDVCLDDSSVSSEHASIGKTEGGYTIEDLNSENGTYLNGERITQAELNNGDTITIGDIQLTIS